MNQIRENKSPIGATKTVTKVNPTFELYNKYNKQGLMCSIEYGGPAVPQGSKEYFQKNGYLIVKNLYDPKELYHSVPKERGQINYWGKNLDQFTHHNEEAQVNGSLARYTHPQYREVHSKIRLILQDILGEELYNTYYYDRFYFKGQRLDRHRDRDACEISVSVQISSNSNQSWPFCLETLGGEEVSVNLEDGWGLVYMGCIVDHWRDPLKSRHNKIKRVINKLSLRKDDTYHHQIFFHYVRANGSRAHCAFDRSR